LKEVVLLRKSRRVRARCSICNSHKWHVKVLLNPEMVTLRVCRFCYRDLVEHGVKVIVLHDGGVAKNAEG